MFTLYITKRIASDYKFKRYIKGSENCQLYASEYVHTTVHFVLKFLVYYLRKFLMNLIASIEI